ncbi:HPr kinase/phosphorylase [Novosphingobium sp.]|uniref:HPr kinase/phosphorylase n=1 Tax=Novosphingobium sp. TaxID=1874826 RepID=UPI0025F080BF|nr:HPr kinase/phosphatase C-terminal domain-containing protein [Novosphingobium sp.]
MTLLANITAVSCGGRGMLIEGPSGSGKSSLALALIDRGAVLIGDDGVMLEPCGGRLKASPPPRTEGLLEVRNVGLLTCTTVQSVPVCLVIRLDSEAPRFIDDADRITLEGIHLPLVRLWPGTPVLALRSEAALRQWGLP